MERSFTPAVHDGGLCMETSPLNQTCNACVCAQSVESSWHLVTSLEITWQR